MSCVFFKSSACIQRCLKCAKKLDFTILTGWWLNQPLWKNMLVKLGIIFPKFSGWKKFKKSLSCHHPVFHCKGQQSSSRPTQSGPLSVFSAACPMGSAAIFEPWCRAPLWAKSHPNRQGPPWSRSSWDGSSRKWCSYKDVVMICIYFLIVWYIYIYTSLRS